MNSLSTPLRGLISALFFCCLSAGGAVAQPGGGAGPIGPLGVTFDGYPINQALVQSMTLPGESLVDWGLCRDIDLSAVNQDDWVADLEMPDDLGDDCVLFIVTRTGANTVVFRAMTDTPVSSGGYAGYLTRVKIRMQMQAGSAEANAFTQDIWYGRRTIATQAQVTNHVATVDYVLTDNSLTATATSAWATEFAETFWGSYAEGGGSVWCDGAAGVASSLAVNVGWEVGMTAGAWTGAAAASLLNLGGYAVVSVAGIGALGGAVVGAFAIGMLTYYVATTVADVACSGDDGGDGGGGGGGTPPGGILPPVGGGTIAIDPIGEDCPIGPHSTSYTIPTTSDGGVYTSCDVTTYMDCDGTRDDDGQCVCEVTDRELSCVSTGPSEP